MDEMNMESTQNETTIQETPRREYRTGERQRPERRRKTQAEIFKETTLPLIILAVAAAFILIFIIGSIVRGVQKHNIEKAASVAAAESIAAEDARLIAEKDAILAQAEIMAANYDFDGAIALIDSFSGNIGAYTELQDARVSYEYNKGSMVAWEDPNQIINLSFQTLVEDGSRAFSHAEYSDTMKRNFITTSEFKTILERLYANNYILVSLEDFIEFGGENEDAPIYQYKTLYLPEGKKPIVLTQTNVNYNLYLVDSDDDMLPDQGGVGIASKMVLQEDGSIACEMVNADGSTSTGAYDMVPILDAFIEAHPDFSYHGAKAVLALTGYNGLFGYRIDVDGREKFGEEAYKKDVESVKAIASALKDSGYDLACYTYANAPYGVYALSEIQADMQQWADEIVPILGNFDIMVFAQESDINSGMLYSGEKYDYLKSIGFNYFLGFSTEGDPFTFIAEQYVRQGRLLVTGKNITENPSWFNTIFDVENLLEASRG